MDAVEYNALGNACAEKGEPLKAITAYSKAIALNPGLAKAYTNRGDAYYDAGEYDKASEDYYRAIRLFRELTRKSLRKIAPALPCYEEGLVLGDRGSYDNAIGKFSEALTLAPAYAEVYLSRGFSYHQKGEYEKAIKDYSAAIGLDLDYARAYAFRGNSYTEQGEHDRALKDYAKALELSPKFSIVYYDLGRSHAMAGKNEEALPCFEKYLSLQPSAYGHMVAWAHYGIACLHALAGRTEAALRAFELALENGLSKREHINNDTDLDQLRGHPRFVKLMKKYLPAAK